VGTRELCLVRRPVEYQVVVGWGGVRQAWQMRFGQFDRITISTETPHIRINGEAAWAVGMEKIELLRKDGKTISFDAFVTNVFEKTREGSVATASQRKISANSAASTKNSPAELVPNTKDRPSKVRRSSRSRPSSTKYMA
jgi:ketosteroid isomerase-like protein